MLLDEVHWLIENRRLTFLLTGSSARKLRRGHANLLAGRARRREMRPLCFPEIDRLDLEQVVLSGLLPPHFLSDDPSDDIRSYINDYLKAWASRTTSHDAARRLERRSSGRAWNTWC